MKPMVLGITFLLALSSAAGAALPVYLDRSFVQDYSEKIPLVSPAGDTKLVKVRADRNGRIIVLSNKGLLQADAGVLKPDRQYRPLTDMQIKDIEVFQDQFVFLTDRDVLSNAWAGQLLLEHQVSEAHKLAVGSQSSVLIVGENEVVRFEGDKPVRWQDVGERIKQVAFDPAIERYLLLNDTGLRTWGQKIRSRVNLGILIPLNCFGFSNDGHTILIGTADGYFRLDPNSFQQERMEKRLPCTDIRCIRAISGSTWFGTPKGAFALRPDGQIDSYASRRWLVDDAVVDLWPGPDRSVLVLSETGLSIIHFREMTLADKATHFDKLTRQRHIRNGFSSSLAMSTPGDLSTGTLVDSDNDGLWTAMYLAGELFRYAVTKSDEALRNCYESFEAMERLSQITPIKGFPARSFERAGYQVADKSRWHVTEDGRWAWKGTTSSDEIVGHFFAYAIFAEVVPEEAWRQRAIALIDGIMDHIVRHNWYLIDYDGKPTQWGRWHPEYVNRFPPGVGDRRLNSVEIIAFLQTAWHFTHKDLYRQKALELLNDYGYLDNITIPMKKLSRVPGIDLTTEWNHSDDELAFLSYWNLYRYAFTPQLREQYREALRDHWEIERPEKNPLWNFLYAATGAEQFDLEESIWSLKEFPLDTISWTVRNSHRQDLEPIGPNFRHQSTKTVLPPDERPMSKYNGNAFRLDGGDGGREEFSGDIFLLPYWLGRYLDVIRPATTP
ncbi:MAG: hypothetical protein M1376_12945 [Planctomycetes bacterium]|nr:hypothetical protein [Planctomycetota bacterium]